MKLEVIKRVKIESADGGIKYMKENGVKFGPWYENKIRSGEIFEIVKENDKFYITKDMHFIPRCITKTTCFSMWLHLGYPKVLNKPHTLVCGRTQGLFDIKVRC